MNPTTSTAPPNIEDQTPDTRERLSDLARQIEAWREAHNVPKERMPTRFRDLNSYRTIERILAGNFDDMKKAETAEKWLAVLESVVAQINTPAPRAVARAFDDFPIALQLRNAFVRTMGKTGPNRFILLIAPTGRGKTQALRALKQLYKSRIIICEASRVWQDKPQALLSEIWKKLGKTDELGFGPAGLDRLAEELNQVRVGIAVDEGHYLGANQLNTLTTLINRTPGEFILAGQPTLWSRLEKDQGVYLETRQLTRNRLSRKLTFADLTEEDADTKQLIDKRASWLNGKAGEATKMLMKHAPQNGNLGFVRNVIERCEEAVEEGAPQSFSTFQAALEAELAER